MISLVLLTLFAISIGGAEIPLKSYLCSQERHSCLLNTRGTPGLSKVMSALKLAVIGATGGLGQRIVKQAVEKGYTVTAIARDSTKAAAVLPAGTTIKIVEGIHQDHYEALRSAISYQDVVIEVIDNTDRIAKAKLIIQAIIAENVPSFVACGGAGELRVSDAPDAQRLYEEVGDSWGAWLKPVTETHLAVQEAAFSSTIPIVAQITPPGMVAGELTKLFEPSKNIIAGVGRCSYEDVADVLLQAIENFEQYNRSMIGMKPRA
jgi:putative NADH-flavin reductase